MKVLFLLVFLAIAIPALASALLLQFMNEETIGQNWKNFYEFYLPLIMANNVIVAIFCALLFLNNHEENEEMNGISQTIRSYIPSDPKPKKKIPKRIATVGVGPYKMLDEETEEESPRIDVSYYDNLLI